MQPVTRWILALAGLALLVGAPTTWYLQQPAETAGELPEELAVTTPSDDSMEDADAAEGDDTDGQRAATNGDRAHQQGTSDSGADDATGDGDAPAQPVTQPASEPRPAPPVALTLPSIGVEEATVVDVALDDDGAVAIPDDVTEVGWYRRGPRPGEAGNAFMTSHVDSRTQGRGVLFDLRRMEPGDPIIVTHADGTTSRWEAVKRERITKGTYPMEQVFRFDGPPGLVIDTCGGAFDPVTGSYENIDIVYAVPADA